MTAVSGISSLAGVVAPVAPTAPSVTGASGASGSSFASSLTGAVQNLQDLQSSADSLSVKAVTSGDLTDVHQATLAATRAQVTMELVSAVRNKGIDAFNQIMSMQA